MAKDKTKFTFADLAKEYKKFIITDNKLLATTANKITSETLVDEFGNFTAEEKKLLAGFDPNKWTPTSKLVKEIKQCLPKQKKRK